MVNNIMAALKTTGSTKSSQSQKSRKTASDDRSAFNQALSDAAGAVNSADNQAADKKNYDKKDAAAAKESTEAVQEATGEQDALGVEKVVGQDAFLSTMQMGAENSQAVEELQASWNQALTESNGNSETLNGDLVKDLGVNTQFGMAKEPVSGELTSGEIPVEMMGQTEELGALNSQADSEFADQMSSMDAGTKFSEQEVSRKDETDIVDVKAEAVVDRVGLSYRHTQGDGVETVQAEVQVTETGDIRQEYADIIKDMIARQIAGGKQEFEISLTPRNLGELLVKVAYEAGETTVSIICTNAKAMQAMSSRASELGKVLETTLGDKMDVVVEQKEQNGSHLYEDGKNGSGAQAQKEELERREAELRKRLEKESSSTDFLHQLRLGLT